MPTSLSKLFRIGNEKAHITMYSDLFSEACAQIPIKCVSQRLCDSRAFHSRWKIVANSENCTLQNYSAELIKSVGK